METGYRNRMVERDTLTSREGGSRTIVPKKENQKKIVKGDKERKPDNQEKDNA